MKYLKKAMISFNMLMFIPRIIFLVAVIFSILLLVRTYIVISVDTFDAESELIYHRFLYSVNGISYYDKDINRLHPGIIDPERFNSTILNKSIDFGEETHIGAMLVLKEIIGDETKIKKTVYYNEALYYEKIKLARAGLTKGPGGARAIKKENPVLYMDKDGKTKKGILEVEIVIPNT